MTERLRIISGDALAMLKTLPDESVQMCVTSPPYWGLRDYGVAGQLGLERTPEEYIARMVEVFREVRRVLRTDGTCWVNMGDSYAGSGKGGNPEGSEWSGFVGNKDRENAAKASKPVIPNGLKPKDLCGIPWRLALALQEDGWWLRQDIIWAKPNPMPESVTDRCTKAHEYLFLLTKSARYYFDAEAIKEPVAESTIGRGPVDFGGAKGRAYTPERTDPNFRNGNEQWGRTFDYTESCKNGRNKRSVWTVATESYPESHFATYPTDLIKPCILAGTSARGCCPKCGAPWERVVEDTPEYAEFKANEKQRKGGGMRSSRIEAMGLTRGSSNKSVSAETKTTGWQATCTCCETETQPCVVLDPFFGSGTTGQVALELGRSCIGIELNPAYLKLAERRCHVTPGLALA